MPSITTPRHTPAIRVAEVSSEAIPQERSRTTTGTSDSLTAALPSRGSRPAGTIAPRAALPGGNLSLSHQLHAAVAEGDVRAVRKLLMAGADPNAFAMQGDVKVRSSIQRLLSAARLIRRLLPQAPDAAVPDSLLLQALRGFDLRRATKLYEEETQDLSVTEAWNQAVEASRIDLLIAIIVLHAGADLEYALGKIPQDDGLNGQLHRPLKMGGAPGLIAHIKQYPYYSEKPGRPTPINLNGAAQFPPLKSKPLVDQDKIVCRHLALVWLMQHESSTGKPDYNALRSIEAIIKHVPRSVDALFDSVNAQSDDVRIVSLANWGEFAVERFRELELSGSATARMLIESNEHAMAVEFKIKPKDRDSQEPQYVLKVYDPNVTTAHKRLSSDDLTRIEAGNFEDLLQSAEAFSDYFNAKETVLVTVGIPVGGVANLPKSPPGGPIDRRVSHELPPLDESVMRHLMRMGLGGTLRDLKAEILALAESSPAEAFDLLNAVNANDNSALADAILFDRADSVAAFCEVVTASTLSQKMQAKLLAGHFDNGVSALAFGMFDRTAAVCRALMDGIIQSGLDADTKTELLAADTAGQPALHAAMKEGCIEAIQAFVESVTRSDLPPANQVRLLTASRKGVPALSHALESGQVDAARAFMEGVARSDALSTQDKQDIIGARDSNGVPGLLTAMQAGQHASVAAFVQTIASSGLPPEVQLEVLLARDPNGTPAVSVAMSKGQTDAVHVFVDWVGASELHYSIQAELFETLLPAQSVAAPVT